MEKIVLVTGASSGIGRETVLLLLKEGGYIVYATARRLEIMDDLKEKGAIPIRLDVTDVRSAESLVEKINAEAGGVDILINNAGYGSLGAIEDVPLEEAKKQFDVNVFGLSNLIQFILPKMREKGGGRIINISSIGGRLSIPLGGWYHATKYAVEGLSNSLRVEVKPFNIDVVLIEPGPIISEWSNIATEHMLQTSGKGSYKSIAELMARNFKLMYSEKHTSKASDIARVVYKSIRAKNPKARYPAGRYAKSILFFKKILNDRLFDRVVSIMIKDSRLLRFLSRQFEKNKKNGNGQIK